MNRTSVANIVTAIQPVPTENQQHTTLPNSTNIVMQNTAETASHTICATSYVATTSTPGGTPDLTESTPGGTSDLTRPTPGDTFDLTKPTPGGTSDLTAARVEPASTKQPEQEDAEPKGRRLDRDRMDIGLGDVTREGKDLLACRITEDLSSLPSPPTSSENPQVASMTSTERPSGLLKAKAKSKCKKCGQLGHWQSDPTCPLYEGDD